MWSYIKSMNASTSWRWSCKSGPDNEWMISDKAWDRLHSRLLVRSYWLHLWFSLSWWQPAWLRDRTAAGSCLSVSCVSRESTPSVDLLWFCSIVYLNGVRWRVLFFLYFERCVVHLFQPTSIPNFTCWWFGSNYFVVRHFDRLSRWLWGVIFPQLNNNN